MALLSEQTEKNMSIFIESILGMSDREKMDINRALMVVTGNDPFKIQHEAELYRDAFREWVAETGTMPCNMAEVYFQLLLEEAENDLASKIGGLELQGDFSFCIHVSYGEVEVCSYPNEAKRLVNALSSFGVKPSDLSPKVNFMLNEAGITCKYEARWLKKNE